MKYSTVKVVQENLPFSPKTFFSQDTSDGTSSSNLVHLKKLVQSVGVGNFSSGGSAKRYGSLGRQMDSIEANLTMVVISIPHILVPESLRAACLRPLKCS
jgi:hypothetical protein